MKIVESLMADKDTITRLKMTFDNLMQVMSKSEFN